MIVAIGDIHAYHHKLVRLLDKLRKEGITPRNTQFVFLGDYIDGGMQAKQVVETIMQIKEECPQTVFLKGNHEHIMLDVLKYRGETYGGSDIWLKQGGWETCLSYGSQAAIPQEHIEWLDALPLYYETDDYYFVHAGFYPNHGPEGTPDIEKMWVRGRFIMSDYDWGKIVVFGHTYQKDGPLILENKIGIDTMHHGGGPLTAVLLPEYQAQFRPLEFRQVE